MIHQDDPKFIHNVKHLVKLVRQIRGKVDFAIRAEDWDPNDPIRAGWITCMHCDSKVSITDECEWKKSRYITYFDTIRETSCCGDDFSDPQLCPVLCVGCERIAIFFTPHKNDTGFEYIAGKEYHLDRCNNCDGTMNMQSLILEQVVHDRLNLNKNTDLDISPN